VTKLGLVVFEFEARRAMLSEDMALWTGMGGIASGMIAVSNTGRANSGIAAVRAVGCD